MVPSEVLRYTTSDGWEAPLRHYAGGGPPVILMHGMGVNHYNWDYRPEVSLADYLQSRGYDVWIPALRGDPGTLAPSRRARRNFNFDDHALLDVPAAVDQVLAQTGESAVLWVGHSLGGMLYYTALAERPETLRAGVSICSPASFVEQPKLYRKIGRWGGLIGKRGLLPARSLARLTLPLGPSNPLLRIIANRENLDWKLLRGIASKGLTNLSKGTASQGVTWIRSSSFSRADGSPWDFRSDVPTLVLAGAGDRLIPEQNVTYACSQLSDCRVEVIGLDEGYITDYGHIDTVLGVSARDEIYPLIGDFLDGQPSVDQGGSAGE